MNRLQLVSGYLGYLLNKTAFDDVIIVDNETTIRNIVEGGKSLARFGDGEFRWIMQDDAVPSFQVGSKKMSDKLKWALSSYSKSLMVGIPSPLFNRKGLKPEAAKFYLAFLARWHKELDSLIDRDREYSDTMISRPYMDYRNKFDFKSRFESLKSIWKKRDVLIVEGERTRFGIGNDLLDGAKSIRRIVCPAENAFSVYDKIVDAIVKCAAPYDLIIACLGPTATILACDLSQRGYQIIDMGHLDIEYEWYLRGSSIKEPIIGKYTNEAGYKGTDMPYDAIYDSSIVSKIGVEGA